VPTEGARAAGDRLARDPVRPDELSGDPGLARGVELFNRGEFWEAHEAWEETWMPHRRRPGSELFKGLIQCAAGFHHYARRNRSGALLKWRTGADILRSFLPAAHGLELASLVDYVDRCHEAVAEAGWVELEPPHIGFV
jgi:predicted metal-dependent hydrolase